MEFRVGGVRIQGVNECMREGLKGNMKGLIGLDFFFSNKWVL